LLLVCITFLKNYTSGFLTLTFNQININLTIEMIARVLYTTTIAAAAQGKNVEVFKTNLRFLFK